MIENEFKIIRQAQKGDAESFGLLYDHYLPKIYRFIFIKTSIKEEAEDFTHEVFLSAWKNIENYDHRGYPFSSWLYQIARNRVIDSYRTKKDVISMENLGENALPVKAMIESELDKEKEINAVKSAIKSLSEDQQNVIILRYIEDLTPAEIAAAINRSEGAVRLIQHRAVVKLREIISKENNERFI